MTSPVGRALALVLLAAVFLRAGFAPVGTIDSWADWKYGQWIWQHGNIPDHDPLSSYSDPKIQSRDGAWLAEVGYYLVVSRGGLEGVSLLHALLETGKAGLFLLAVRRATGSMGTAVAATALMEVLCWPFFSDIRTGTPAEVCWAGLLLTCSGRVPRWADVLAAAAIVALWANLSPTFGFAFVLLAGLLVGRFVQEVRARRRVTAAVRDPAVRRLALALGLSVAAACCNPHGYAHLHDWLGTVGLAVLPARLWPRLIPVDSWESRMLIASVLLLLFVLRLSPRPMTPAEVLLSAGFVLWAWFDKRVAPWWLMLAPWLLAPHLHALFSRERPASAQRPLWPGLLTGPPAPTEGLQQPWGSGDSPGDLRSATVARSGDRATTGSASAQRSRLNGKLMAGLLTGLAVGLVLLSPAARWAVGKPLSAEQRVGQGSLYRVAEDLPRQPGRRVFCLPYWWGDYLLWTLPDGDQVYWYSRPEGFMGRGKDPGLEPSPAEWRALVKRHGFDTLVVGPESARSLAEFLAEEPPGKWTVVSDRGPVVVSRTLTPDP